MDKALADYEAFLRGLEEVAAYAPPGAARLQTAWLLLRVCGLGKEHFRRFIDAGGFDSNVVEEWDFEGNPKINSDALGKIGKALKANAKPPVRVCFKDCDFGKEHYGKFIDGGGFSCGVEDLSFEGNRGMSRVTMDKMGAALKGNATMRRLTPRGTGG